MANYLFVSPSDSPWRNLAIDEWFLEHGQADTVLFFYINRPSVIIGRNQNPWRECDLSAMNRDHVTLARRISGGGAVYHDAGNLNFSFNTPKSRYDVEKQLSLISETVRSIGIDCSFSGRNDLLADGRKFSGNAFCCRENRCQHHGTLLVNTELGKLGNYLRPDPEKMAAKGIASVRSRVCNLSDFQPTLTVSDLLAAIPDAYRRLYGDCSPFCFTEAQEAEIAAYEQKQQSEAWRFGKTPPFTVSHKKRFPFGSLEFLFDVKEGYIRDLAVYTDANRADLPELLASLLVGLPYQKDAVCRALKNVEESEQAPPEEGIFDEIASFFAEAL